MAEYIRFPEPRDTLNYADMSYVGSHGSCQYQPFFDATCQEGCITTQLDFGIRGFMMGVYEWNLGMPFTRKGPGSIIISDCEKPVLSSATPTKCCRVYQTLQLELGYVISWMQRHPAAIVTIFLDDNIDPGPLAEEIIAAAAAYDPIFRPGDHTLWPTLGWMRENNKRLVIFTRRAFNTQVTWSQFAVCWENISCAHLRFIYREQPESAGRGDQRQIVVFNNYAARDTSCVVPSLLQGEAKYLGSKAIMEYVKEKGYARGRKINGYFINNILAKVSLDEKTYKKTVFDVVTEMNK